MKIEGMDSWLDKIETLKTDFPRETGQFLSKMASDTIREIKNDPLHPVDTGTLRNSWFKVSVRGKGGRASFQQIIYNNTSYAHFVEWGFRIKRGGKTVGFVKGRYMLHRGVAKTRMKFYRELDKLYKKLLAKG